MRKVKVLIVDDSRLIQSVLSEMLSTDGRFDVVGVAENPHEARELIKALEPDVLTLDVEMPKMNGITFLRNLMRLRPLPVVMISTLTAKGAGVTLEALELGAVDFIEKPANIANDFVHYQRDVCDKVFAASQVSRLRLLDVQHRLQGGTERARAETSASTTAPITKCASSQIPSFRICAIGGSTGGLEALTALLKSMRFTGQESILVCLHLPAGFTTSFANRLNGLLPVNVKEAEPNELVRQGNIYIAPGGRHMEVKKTAQGYCLTINDNEPVNRHRPSVDVLFDAVTREVNGTAMALLLTGMGKDGAQGLLRLRQKGALTFIQDEASSVVWGMPGAAFALGAVEDTHVLPLPALGTKIMRFFHTSSMS